MLGRLLLIAEEAMGLLCRAKKPHPGEVQVSILVQQKIV